MSSLLIVLSILLFGFFLWIVVDTARNFERLGPSETADEGAQRSLPSGLRAHVNSERVTLDQIAEIEQTIPGLTTVVIVAREIVEPSGKLKAAVFTNASRKVRYISIVSSRNTDEKIKQYARIFYNAGELAGLQENELLHFGEVHRLKTDWNDCPYIFYIYDEGRKSEEVEAYRGLQIGIGIASNYEKVPPDYAFTIENAVRGEAPQLQEFQHRDFIRSEALMETLEHKPASPEATLQSPNDGGNAMQ